MIKETIPIKPDSDCAICKGYGTYLIPGSPAKLETCECVLSQLPCKAEGMRISVKSIEIVKPTGGV